MLERYPAPIRAHHPGSARPDRRVSAAIIGRCVEADALRALAPGAPRLRLPLGAASFNFAEFGWSARRDVLGVTEMLPDAPLAVAGMGVPLVVVQDSGAAQQVLLADAKWVHACLGARFARTEMRLLPTCAEFEVDLIRVRTREGMAVAKAPGR